MQHTLIPMFLFCFYRVLKPPGGGTSDIFGGAVPNTPRSQKNRMASNIFAAPSDIKNGNGRFPKWIVVVAAIYTCGIHIYIYIWMNWYRFYESEREPNKWRKKKSILFSKYTFLSLLFPFPIIIQPIDKDPIDTFSSVYSLTFYSRILKNKKQKIAKSNSTHDINHQFTLFAVTQ